MARKLKLVIHVASKDRWKVASKNAFNFLKSAEEGDELQVAIVANADAVTTCTECDRALFDRLKQVVIDGGKIYLCANSLRDFDIAPDRPPEIFDTVPAAIRALAEFQADGWIYVRA